jgi:hypothetical protein
MVVGREDRELSDMSPGKTPEPVVQQFSEDSDQSDREQLAKLGKKSVLKACSLNYTAVITMLTCAAKL